MYRHILCVDITNYALKKYRHSLIVLITSLFHSPLPLRVCNLSRAMSQLRESPLPFPYFLQVATIYCLAFDNGAYAQWLARTAADAIIHTCDQIPSSRLDRVTQEYIHRELNPRVAIVCAVSEDKVVGFSTWVLPASLSKRDPRSIALPQDNRD